VIVEYVGGPLCGQVKTVNALASEYDEAYSPRLGEHWEVTYARSGLRTGRGFRYNFAGQRRVDTASSL
jgi:hypothetical protein